MKRKCPICVTVFAVALGVAFAANAAGTWYAKPEAAGSGDGSDWANAATLESAVTAAGAAGGGDVYVAKGVHYPAATLQVKNGVNLYGGFAGTDGETLDDRDSVANETIVCGDTGKNDVWTLLYPADGTSAASAEPIVKDGKINIPTFATDYDTCWNALSKGANLSRLVNVAGSATNVLDGLVFACGGYNDYAGAYLGSEANVTLSGCRFVACYSAYPILFAQSGNQTTVTNCTFEYCRSVNYGVVHLNGSSTIVDCDFIGNYRAYAGITDATGAVALKVDEDCYVRKCRFSRNYLHHGNAAHAQASVCIARTDSYTSSGVSGCTMTHNSAYDTTGQATPMLRHNQRYQITENCTIASNRVTVATDAKSVVAVAAHYANVAPSGVLVSCSVFDNEISVSAPNATQVDAAPVASVSSGVDTDMTLLNCTFRDNAVRVTSGAEATNNVARAALMRVGADPDKHRVLAVFNSTFSGATAGPDILYAGTELEGGGCVAYNSVLWATGEAAKTPRVVNAGIAPVKVGYSTVVDPTALADNVTQTEVRSDDPLLEDLAVLAAGRVPVIRLGAAVPGVRTTVDVIRGHYWSATVYWHRFPGSSTWLQCANYTTHTPSAAEQQAFLADALATARTAGTFTEGAVQAFAPLAETGMTVVLRPDPANVGYVEGGNTHVLPADNATESLSAVCTNSSYAFHSWRTTDGKVVSKANPFVWTAPGPGTTNLVARFNPIDIVYTFDLGEHGTFDVCGLSVTNVVFATDDPVVVPAYTAKSGSIFRRWSPSLPETVGDGDASFAAEFVTRVTTVEPGGDLADALAGAALYPDEAVVRLATGTHTVSAAASVPANVTLVGEDGAVLKSSTTYSLADAGSSGTLTVSNVTFSGATLQQGKRPATFVGCCFTNATANGAFAGFVATTNATFLGCRFVNNVCAFHTYVKAVLVFESCEFLKNRNGTTHLYNTGVHRYNYGILVAGDKSCQVTKCLFRANTNSYDGGYGLVYGEQYCAITLKNTAFEENYLTNGNASLVKWPHYGYSSATGCRFVGNTNVGGDVPYNKHNRSAELIYWDMQSRSYVDSCSFVSNTVICVARSADTSVTASIVPGEAQRMRRCLFIGNRLSTQQSDDTLPHLAFVLSPYAPSKQSGFCNMTFLDNEAANGAVYVDLVQTYDLNVVDSIFRDCSGTKPLVLSSSATVPVKAIGCEIAEESDERITYTHCADDTLSFGNLRTYQGHVIRPQQTDLALRQVAVPVVSDKNGNVWAEVNGTRVVAFGIYSSSAASPYTPITDMFGAYDDRNICGAHRRIKSALRVIVR